MGYVDENLLPGEEVAYRAKLHWIVFSFPVVLLAFGLLILSVSLVNTGPGTESARSSVSGCGFAFVLVAGIVALLRSLALRTSEFAVTNKRVLIKVGWIRRHSLELLLSKVEGIGVDQGLFGRWLGYGTITVTGTGGTKEPFRSISDPLSFRKEVQARIPS
jgi:uncharacterized membrane protein YdbT with pleckstrin-like domain